MAHMENHRAAIDNCGRAQDAAPLTEPTIVANVFITGGAVCVTDTTVRLIGWEQIPSVEGEMVERRIATRIIMSTDTAREVVSILRNALAKGGH